MSIAPDGAALNIANGVREFAAVTPEVTAVVDGDRTLTYAQLGERAARLANALLDQRLGDGAHVAICLGNRLEFPEIACGIAMAGMVMVPLNPRYTQREARFVVEHSDARAVVVDRALADVVRPVAEDRGLPLIVLGATPADSPYEELLAASSPVDPRRGVAENSPFCIAYTSGTTGDPKGVVISHRSRVLTFYQAATEWGLGTGRTSLAVAPMYHGAGFAFGYAPVFTGGTVVMLRRWDPEEMLSLASQHRVQSIFLVPAHATMLRQLPPDTISGYDLSALDTLYFNAAALPFELKRWVFEAFPDVGVHELYGSTEAGIVTNLRPVDMRRKPGSVGKAWYMTEIRVLDALGQTVGPGGTGELYSRSPYLMRGYYKNPEATRACTTEDGFVTCGDLVTLDEEGYIFIVGRSSDTIVSGGVNVYPREVEDVLLQHPSVADVAVVGAPSERWGEQVAAVVVIAQGADFDPEELDRHCRSQLAGFKVPRQWKVTAELPRNAAGKVVKRNITI